MMERFWHGGGERAFANGVAVTNEEGEFEIRFTPRKSDRTTWRYDIYSFMVEAQVTDLNGETQGGRYNVMVGDVLMILSIDLAEKVEKEGKAPIVIGAKNLDGRVIEAKGDYVVYSVQENDSIGNRVLSGSFETGEQPKLKKELAGLRSGKYRIQLRLKDDRGNDVEMEQDFVLFSYADKRPPIETNEWLLRKRTVIAKGQPAEVILGVSDRDVHVLYELYAGRELQERRWLRLSHENRLFRVEYKEEYAEGATLMLTYAKDGQFYAHQVDLLSEVVRSDLDVRLDVFRDKVRPGSDEEWRISVRDAKGDAVPAEVMASMYDFSLDQIYKGWPWRLRGSDKQSYRSVSLLRDNYWMRHEFVASFFKYDYKEFPYWMFDRLNWFGFRMDQRILRHHVPPGGVLHVTTASQVDGDVVGEEEETLFYLRDLGPNRVLNLADSQAETAPQVRRNFDETAFFFPQLRTNADGETLIAFKVPDSNTKWRFRVLVHDKDLNVGQTEEFVVSQKELMVTPNMPRFVRHGDRASIATKVSNLSEGALSGVVRLEFFDVLTDEVVKDIALENQQQEFTLEAGASGSAVWMFDVPMDVELLGVRIVAQSDGFSDGEQHALPVLPNRMLVTESMRMDLDGNEDKVFSFDRLVNRSSASQSDYRLTLEFSSDPSWYALQALPLLGTPDSDNAVSWFAAFYANMLGAHIGRTYPKVSAMVEAWKKQGGTSETLLSNLEKNEGVKRVLLEETPWILEAKSESEQKQQLALLFDLNRNSQMLERSLHELWELKYSQGGWGWFKGFYPNVGITHYILYGLSQLRQLKAMVNSEKIRTMQWSAVSYIDQEALRRFDRLKEENKDWRSIQSIPTVDLEYLFVRSKYRGGDFEKVSEMIDFYTDVVERYWTNFNLYERSLIVQLVRESNRNLMLDITTSMRQHATYDDELGMYWANNRSSVFMSQSAILVHTFIMEAFKITGINNQELDGMNRWLLKQKQTQLWESTHATTNAVHALLRTRGDWFTSEGETDVSLGGMVVELKYKDLGTGYFKESWSKMEITPEMGNVMVSHRGEGPAWGALYYQYFEDLDKISQHDGELNVQKGYFVERVDADGKHLVAVTEDASLEVGDKVVVRLTVRVDRDMQFVHLKDMRASAFEPIDQVSKTTRVGGVLHRRVSRDTSTNFYFDHLPKGTYVLEYGVYVTRSGSYSGGVTTIQSMYAPEFVSHTAGMRINVK